MGNWLEMGDSSTPPETPTHLPVYGFYMGGDTPHVWTDPQIEALDSRWVLPIFTQTNPDANLSDDAYAIVRWLHDHGYKPGECVAVDVETRVMPQYLSQLNIMLHNAGYMLITYESKGPLEGNPVTLGGRWVADWTGQPHMYPGAVATQYASATMTHGAWDQSVIDATVRLHQLHPPVVHPIPYVMVNARLPQLAAGDTGPAVARLQGLLEAWRPGVLGPAGIDGKLGPDTSSAVRLAQRVYGILVDVGQVTGETWERLLEG